MKDQDQDCKRRRGLFTGLAALLLGATLLPVAAQAMPGAGALGMLPEDNVELVQGRRVRRRAMRRSRRGR